MSDSPTSEVGRQSKEEFLKQQEEVIRNRLHTAVENCSEQSLQDLFEAVNEYAYSWLTARRLLQMSREVSDLFSAASALISSELSRSQDPTSLLTQLVEVLESAQTRNNNYGVQGLDDIPTERLHITATGGERSYRTLYVTIATGLICSHYIHTIVQGNYSVTGCGCGAFAESDMMEFWEYPIGSSVVDLFSLRRHRFAYLHVQRYHPILKVFCSERGSLGFRDMMKLVVALADPLRCRYQFIGVWDKKFMEPMAKVLGGRTGVVSGAVVASEQLDEFTTEACLFREGGGVKRLYADGIDELLSFTEPNPGGNSCALVSETILTDECEKFTRMFDEAIEHASPRLKFVLHNAALALAVSHSNGLPDWQEVSDWRKRITSEWSAISEHSKQLMEGWKTLRRRSNPQ
jgi:anthranilate phosphoribosyltransferase